MNKNTVGQDRHEFKVNVYTRDFRDIDEVGRSERSIVSNLSIPLGRIGMLSYKPEIYSELDIYAGNHFGSSGSGIRPVMFSSKLIGSPRRRVPR